MITGFVLYIGLFVYSVATSLIFVNEGNFWFGMLIGIIPSAMFIYAVFVVSQIKYSERQSGWLPGACMSSLKDNAIVEADIEGRRRIKTDSVRNIKDTFKQEDILRIRKQTALDKIF